MKTFGELPSSYEVSMSYEEQIELLTRKINEIIEELEKYIPTDLAKVATTGEYNDLLNKPDLSDYITKDVDDLTYYTKSSSLSTVATTGSYDDLTNKPSIPTKTSDIENDSGFITKEVDDLTNYTKSSSLSTVATTGDYTDLLNKPTIPTVPTNVSSFTNDAGYITKDVDDLTYYTKTSSLSAVATTGSYDDLTNKPTIPTVPTNVSSFTNDAGYVTLNEVIESGSNTNGNYIKYADGTMICTNRVEQTKNITNVYEGSYFESINSVSFPQTFISNPNITVTIEQNNSLIGFNFTNISTTLFNGYLWKAQSKSNVKLYIQYIAIGKWK